MDPPSNPGHLNIPLSYSKRVGLLHKIYMGSDTTEGFGKTIVSTVDAALLVGLCLVGWQLNGWIGVTVAVVVGVTMWGIARGIVWLIGGAIVSVCVVLPLSAVLALWEPASEVRAAVASGWANT
jgi:hypothetical protein